MARRFGMFKSNHAEATFSKDEQAILKRLDQVRTVNDYVKPVPVQQPEIVVLAVTDAQPKGKGYVIFDVKTGGVAESWF